MCPLVLLMLSCTLGLGTAITFSASNMLMAWVGLELNTLAILPLLSMRRHPRALEATAKYFLVQASAGGVILISALSNAWITGQWQIEQLSDPLATSVIIIALSMKVGLAPTHLWLPEVLQGLDLTMILVLSTWQKLAPFALLIQIPNPSTKLIVIIGLISILAGGWGGLNQTQLRKILAYSSTAHLGWMMMTLYYYPSLTLLALIAYITMTCSTILVFNTSKATDMKSLGISSNKLPAMTTIAPLILLSLGGLPPLTGFAPKWLILQELVNQGLMPLAVLAALSALLSLYYYLRLAYVFTLVNSPNTTMGICPWRPRPPFGSLIIATMTMMTLALMPILPLVIAIFLP